MKSLSHVRLFATPWTIAHQAPLFMGFSRQEYWSGLPFPFSRGSSRPRDQTQVSHIAGRRFNLRATREALAEASRFKKVKKTIAQKKQGSQDLNSELLNPNCMSAPLSQAIPLSSQFSCGPSNWMLDDLIIDQDGDSRSRDTPCVQGPTLGPSSSQG